MNRLTLLGACLCLSALVPAPAALAQTTPRPIPEGFVLPGPPPTNAPPGASPTARPDAASPEAGAEPGALPSTQTGIAPGASRTVSGAMAVPAPAVAPAAGTTQLLGGRGAQGNLPWPCVQRKVEQVDAAQVWPGPSLDDAKSVPRTDAMRQLVATIAARRLPLPEAEAAAATFVKALPADQRSGVATAIFADLLALLNQERTQIMRGIERYGAKQQALAARLREANAAISALRTKGETAKAEEAQEALLWDTRVFDERRRSLTYVCEVPTLIEQRLFALGRAVSGGLKG